MLIPEHLRVRINENDKEYLFCNLTLCEIADEDIPSLINLLSQNSHIQCIDLDRNPDLSMNGFTKLQEAFPKIKFINVGCLKSIETLLEESTLTRSTLAGGPYLISSFFDKKEKDEMVYIGTCSSSNLI